MVRCPRNRGNSNTDTLAQLAEANLGTYHAWLLCEVAPFSLTVVYEAAAVRSASISG